MGKAKRKKGPGAKAAKRRKEQKRHAKSCVGKQQYASREEARVAMWRLRDAAAPVGMDVYKCRSCSAWHIGHRPR